MSSFNRSKLAFANSTLAEGTAASSLLSYRLSNSFALLTSCFALGIRRVFRSIFVSSILACMSRISLLDIGNPYLSKDSASEFTRVPADVGALSLESAYALLAIKSIFGDRNDMLDANVIPNNFAILPDESIPSLILPSFPRIHDFKVENLLATLFLDEKLLIK